MSSGHSPASANSDEHGSHGDPSFFSRIVASIGFVITIIIILWGILHIIALVRGTSDPISFGSWFKTTTQSAPLTVNAPAEASAGAEITIDWQHKDTRAGNYSFMYTCGNGLTFDAIIPGRNNIPLPCGTMVTASTTNNTIAVMPELTGTENQTALISIIFTPSDSGTPVEGKASIVIHPGAAPVQTSSTKTGSTGSHTNTTTSQATRTGPADLTVRIVSIGVVDPQTGGIVSGIANSLDDTIAVRFDIANNGGTATGPWTFDAELPTINGYHYISPVQQSLAPGDHILNTLKFTEVSSGGGTFSIQVNADRLVRESNYKNDTVTITVPAANYQ